MLENEQYNSDSLLCDQIQHQKFLAERGATDVPLKRHLLLHISEEKAQSVVTLGEYPMGSPLNHNVSKENFQAQSVVTLGEYPMGSPLNHNVSKENFPNDSGNSISNTSLRFIYLLIFLKLPKSLSLNGISTRSTLIKECFS